MQKPYIGSNNLYDQSFEHDNCGIGFTANIDGTRSHKIVSDGIRMLVNLEHRGAVGGDNSTGDGAGLLMEIPDKFFRSQLTSKFTLPQEGKYATGMIFFPENNSFIKKCKSIIHQIVEKEEAEVLGWRSVPTDKRCLQGLALRTEPVVKQIFIGRNKIDESSFARKLYVIRRQIEKEVDEWRREDDIFYIASLSEKIIVYKGLLTGTQLPQFYTDLQNDDFQSAFAIIHQRFSTNTLPTWHRAQPMRYIAHNGEFNTLQGNINRMKAREATLSSGKFGDNVEKIKPVIDISGSDSAIFDNVLEFYLNGGRRIPHVMMMMVPEAYSPEIQMSADKRAFYEFHSAIMEPWDGPAALVFSDGRYIGATLDRNGLRPIRYTLTKEGQVVLASETGVLDIDADKIQKKGRIKGGKMFLVDLKQQRIVPDNEIKAKISRRYPYRQWVERMRIKLRGLFSPSTMPKMDSKELLRKQLCFGYTDEEVKHLILPMVKTGQEAIGSMGNDTAIPIMSQKTKNLFNYFKQQFAQVTNPPIDPLREELVMSLESFVGREYDSIGENPQNYRGLKLHHPVLSFDDLERLKHPDHPDLKSAELDILFQPEQENLETRLETIFAEAKCQIKINDVSLLILTDRNLNKNQVPIPVILAASGLNHYLIAEGLRTRAAIIVETGEVREVMHFALLLGYGTDAICPYLAFQTVRKLYNSDYLSRANTPGDAMDSYITAVKKGLLKTFSRMGISTVHGFFGTQIFEAVGLNEKVVDKYFTGTPSRIGGMGLKEIARESRLMHKKAFPGHGNLPGLLEAGGEYRIRKDGEKHFWNAKTIYKLQYSVRQNDYKEFKDFSHQINAMQQDAGLIRGLIDFKERESVSIEEVEAVDSIVTRFATAAMSMGSISKEAHETIAIAMNRLGGKSNSGEGGEDPARFQDLPNGDSKCSAIKQVASGRFGVTTEYLRNAREIQIKMAQGAKPGEGGQLPGHKVSEEIARIRHTTPGVTLISPPPHHDIYSIEDLAQLIYDLKSVSDNQRVSVKLVSEAGVGTVAAGVAKAKADMVLISGQDGGTGASPLTAIKHAGLPWELGLAEAQQTLVQNCLRDQIRVQVDGQLRTGRDLAIATLLGAEEYGFGTSVLVTLGCVLMRKCHKNTCPVGIATQDPNLRKNFKGKPEYVERFLRFLAQDFRETMAQLGFRTVDEMVGHVDALDFKKAINHWKAENVNLAKLLNADHLKNDAPLSSADDTTEIKPADLELELVEPVQQAINKNKKVKIVRNIRNVHRTVGSYISGKIVDSKGLKGLPEDSVKLQLHGSAGQSVGAFLASGISMEIEGDANDYLGKGMSGGRIILKAPEEIRSNTQTDIICGNVALYGATQGEVFINGSAGERFAVRNSGATAVVEGVGDHGCEYMTGGTVIVLGETGKNFAAGMTGGIAYVYDPAERFDTNCNLDMVILESVWKQEDKDILKKLITKHNQYTNSYQAEKILKNWDANHPLFVKVVPIDYKKVLERMEMKEGREKETVSATEEVYFD
ncbi:MAG TPA: glutamate synthase large subunit [bacterium]|nr:glutamate synthase large subunit [bacterium]